MVILWGWVFLVSEAPLYVYQLYLPESQEKLHSKQVHPTTNFFFFLITLKPRVE